MKRKYGLLGVVAFLLQLLGALAVIGAIIGIGLALYLGYAAEPRQDMQFLIAQSISILVGGVVLYAFGSLINVYRDVELNTRRSSYYLMQLARRSRLSAERRAARTANQAQTPRRQRPIMTETLPKG